MRTVICDTNVWYDSFPNQEYEVRFIGTFINIFEIAQSRNWTKMDKTRVRAAAKSIWDNSHEIRMDNPWAQIASKSGLSFTDANDYSAEDRVEFLLNIAQGRNFDDTGLALLKERIGERHDGLRILINDFNGAIRQVRSIGQKLEVRSKRVQRDVIRELVAFRISMWAHVVVECSQIKWESIELFMEALHHFVFNPDVGKTEAAVNDLGDLLNLLYVGPGEFYLTREKYWNDLIRHAGMAKYLHEIHPPQGLANMDL